MVSCKVSGGGGGNDTFLLFPDIAVGAIIF
jgi:hypothetical protein